MNFRNAEYSMKKKKNSRKRCSIYHWKLTENNAEIFRSIGRRPNKQTNKQTKNPVGRIIFGLVHTALEKLGN